MLLITSNVPLNIPMEAQSDFQLAQQHLYSAVMALKIGDWLQAGDSEAHSVKIIRVTKMTYTLVITKPGASNTEPNLRSTTAFLGFAASFGIVWNRAIHENL